MKAAILTANIGGIDKIVGIPKQTIDVDYYCYFDHNLPFPLPNLNDRLKSKYVKIMTHRFLPGYDAYIWIDGRVEITSVHFAEMMTHALEESNVAIFRHPERQTIGEEMEFIEQNIRKGNHYLLSRYGNQQMDKEQEFYQQKEALDLPLFACTLFSRRNNDTCNAAFEEWWRRCIEFSYFDQAMFACVVPQYCHLIKTLDQEDYKNIFTINRHVL